MAENSKEDEIPLQEHSYWNKESKELRTAIYDDWKRKAVNDAKFRACDQHVDYPTFANLVSVAHLKPVVRKTPGEEFEDEERPAHIYKGTSAPAWSFDSAGTEKPANEEDAADGLPALLGLRKPGSNRTAQERITDDEFAKNWRRLNKDVFLQMAFLTGINPANYPEIFKVELPPNLLADILATICTCFRAEENARDHPDRQRLLRAACARDVDESWAVRMLEAMTKCGRFSLAIGFVGVKTRAMVRALIAHLVDSDWCKSEPAKKENSTSSQPSRLSRIQNIVALYRLQPDQRKLLN
ncbi:hypothetical protein KC19_1G027800 [Ceratodon purpureus]|uniref:Uncharacterized protein n=1 Tax=Ceratodon purpureus TaxID=3225 RepID=A0A8T0J342_CERPU|nr:hypothetical protein KC19_1G027800 [Ceratodon purpureus]